MGYAPPRRGKRRNVRTALQASTYRAIIVEGGKAYFEGERASAIDTRRPFLGLSLVIPRDPRSLDPGWAQLCVSGAPALIIPADIETRKVNGTNDLRRDCGDAYCPHSETCRAAALRVLEKAHRKAKRNALLSFASTGFEGDDGCGREIPVAMEMHEAVATLVWRSGRSQETKRELPRVLRPIGDGFEAICVLFGKRPSRRGIERDELFNQAFVEYCNPTERVAKKEEAATADRRFGKAVERAQSQLRAYPTTRLAPTRSTSFGGAEPTDGSRCGAISATEDQDAQAEPVALVQGCFWLGSEAGVPRSEGLCTHAGVTHPITGRVSWTP